MRRVINSGAQRIEVLNRCECSPEDVFIEFYDHVLAFSFLYPFMRDHFNRMVLRNALASCLHCAGICRFSDHEICQQLSRLIARGCVRLVLREGRQLYMDTQGGTWGGAREAVEGDTEAATQATQTADAVQDTTAVERREPAWEPLPEIQPVVPVQRREQVRKPEARPPEPALVPVGAAAAQAATMVLAAESGTPFCDT